MVKGNIIIENYLKIAEKHPLKLSDIPQEIKDDFLKYMENTGQTMLIIDSEITINSIDFKLFLYEKSIKNI